MSWPMLSRRADWARRRRRWKCKGSRRDRNASRRRCGRRSQEMMTFSLSGSTRGGSVPVTMKRDSRVPSARFFSSFLPMKV